MNIAKSVKSIIGKGVVGKKRGAVPVVAYGFIYISFEQEFFIHPRIHPAKHKEGGRSKFRFWIGQVYLPEFSAAFEPKLPIAARLLVSLKMFIKKLGLLIAILQCGGRF